MDDKAPRAVLANSGQVATVTSPMSWERNQSAPMGVCDSRLAVGVTLQPWAQLTTLQAMHNSGGGTWLGEGLVVVSYWVTVHVLVEFELLCALMFAHKWKLLTKLCIALTKLFDTYCNLYICFWFKLMAFRKCNKTSVPSVDVYVLCSSLWKAKASHIAVTEPHMACLSIHTVGW